MRRCCLVCYDIRDPKRLRRIHKLMKGYGEPWQYSIFFCVLREIDRVRLRSELEEVANLREDSVLIIDLGQDERAFREGAQILGRRLPESEVNMLVV